MTQYSLFTNLSLSVSDLTRYLRQLFESDEILQDVWVLGEISNLKYHTSGHVYFTLKDSGASLNCVIWRRDAARIRLSLQNGMAVEAHGSIGIYEQAGQYQLYVTSVRFAGDGLLYQQFMRLKAQLEAEGLFDDGRKRPAPAKPARIGIVTSPTGAALQDMLNTLRRRYPLVEVIVSPCSVQGYEAPDEICAAIRKLCEIDPPDVIILARGGGSIEDLWAFNDERVVRAICASPIPIITGVGHETDFTLADFAADVRAPTPTGAAVLATPDIAEIREGLVSAVYRLQELALDRLGDCRDELRTCDARLGRVSPLWQVRNARQRMDETSDRLERVFRHGLDLRRAHWRGASQRLESINPRAVLQRGYAIVTRQDGVIVRRVNDVSAGAQVRVDVSDGSFGAEVK